MDFNRGMNMNIFYNLFFFRIIKCLKGKTFFDYYYFMMTWLKNVTLHVTLKVMLNFTLLLR